MMSLGYSVPPSLIVAKMVDRVRNNRRDLLTAAKDDAKTLERLKERAAKKGKVAPALITTQQSVIWANMLNQAKNNGVVYDSDEETLAESLERHSREKRAKKKRVRKPATSTNKSKKAENTEEDEDSDEMQLDLDESAPKGKKRAPVKKQTATAERKEEQGDWNDEGMEISPLASPVASVSPASSGRSTPLDPTQSPSTQSLSRQQMQNLTRLMNKSSAPVLTISAESSPMAQSSYGSARGGKRVAVLPPPDHLSHQEGQTDGHSAARGSANHTGTFTPRV
jgi:hypothetical protein